jgi:DNA-binding protein YbaB
MNPMQQMLMEANRINHELAKQRAELSKKEFTSSKAGLLSIVMLGDRSIKEIKFAPGAVTPENEEVLSESLGLALNDLLKQIDEAAKDINEKVTGRREGF